MPTLYTAGAMIAGSALLSLLMLTGDGAATEQNVVEVPASIPTDVTNHQAQITAKNTENSPGANKQNQNSQVNQPTPTMNEQVTTETAKRTRDALDQVVNLPESFRLVDLPTVIASAADVPVILDQRGIEYAQVEIAKQTVDVSIQDAPLRSVLRTALEPIGLKAIVEDEGLLITADPSVLVHRGIGISRWINVDEDAEKEIAEWLEDSISIEYYETPLDISLQKLSDDRGLSVFLDRQALEDVGLTTDTSVTITLNDVGLANALDLMLGDLDLTYTVRGETLSITTVDAVDSQLLSRVYWLEGTGFLSGNSDSLIDSIQASINPNSWEAVGGPATVSLLDSGDSVRPAIVVSNTYRTHRQIEEFIAALRETHFGSDPTAASGAATVRNNRSPKSGGAMGGGGFGGGFQ